MNFSIGFFVGGQVLAGILGSAVTLPYGPEGKHARTISRRWRLCRRHVRHGRVDAGDDVAGAV
ncbi:MAG: hypothetical protein U1F83_06440 [Verrucomicrobiota bacterium]